MKIVIVALTILFLSGCMRINPGIGAALRLSGTQADIGSVVVGKTVTYTVALKNTGDFDAAGLKTPTLVAPFAVVASTCSGTLAVGDSCEVEVSFTPTAIGEVEAKFAITFFDGAQDRTVKYSVVGRGVTVAVLTIAEAPQYDFGSVQLGDAPAKTFTVTNTGGMVAEDITLDVSPCEAHSLVENNCGEVLAPGESCTFITEFRPVSSGWRHMFLDLNYFDGETAQMSSLEVVGTGYYEEGP